MIEPSGLAVDNLTRMRACVAGEERTLPKWLGDKRASKHFVKFLGVAVPPTLRSFESIGDIDLAGLPGRFVLKPTFLSSAYGVMVLRREGDEFIDDLHGRTLTEAEIIAEQLRRLDAAPEDGIGRGWVAEEVVADASGADVPDDWKFYAFQGRIGLIHRTVRATPRNEHSYFSGSFEPIPIESGLYSVNERLVAASVSAPPRSWRQLLRDVRRISIATPSPFVRIDMYDAAHGPVFGEFTVTPGTFFYEDREQMSLTLSSRLGLLWDEASWDLA